MGNRTSHRRFGLSLLVGMSLLAGGCTVAGPISSLLAGAASTGVGPVPSTSSAVPVQSLATPMPTSIASRPAGDHPTITGILLAGPSCPVETVPPDPACAPRPVVDAVVIATDQQGHEVGRALSDNAGHFEFVLAPGTYTLAPQATTDAGWRIPGPKVVDAGQGSSDPVEVDFVYDTGIR